ncbi:MAG: hypothetical protein GY929_15820 [Actinomycetia bacterium]|nr:hypothetical protein [Actinomycetes bacterium]
MVLLFEMGLGMDTFAPDRARGYPLARLQPAGRPEISIRTQRAFDAGLAATVLLLTLPISVATATLVKATSPGPVLFSQIRMRQHNWPVTISKFRSMRMSDASDHEWAAEERVTRIRRLIRRLNLDELARLCSVFRSTMSLVGPRAERLVFVEAYRDQVPDYDHRHRMPIGTTGRAHVVGQRGDTSISKRVKCDTTSISTNGRSVSTCESWSRRCSPSSTRQIYASRAAELKHAPETRDRQIAVEAADSDLYSALSQLNPPRPVGWEPS